MSGMFDKESTITLDPAAPIIVFDTSGPVFQDPTLKRVYTAAVSSWIDRLLQARDGLRRIIVCEEAWDLLSIPSWSTRCRPGSVPRVIGVARHG